MKRPRKNKFMIDSIINCSKIEEAEVLLLTIGYDRTASHRKGTAGGGMAIVKCLHEDVEFFDRYTKRDTGYEHKIAHLDMGNLNDLYPEDMVLKVKEKYKNYGNVRLAVKARKPIWVNRTMET